MTEHSSEEKTFLFYGIKLNKEKGETIGVLGAINFSKIFKRDCKGNFNNFESILFSILNYENV